MLCTARPQQWIKNLLVVAAPGAAGAFGHHDVVLRVGGAFIAFCMLASGIYAINDVRDVDDDRRHPVKCRRPVAVGDLDQREAVVMGILLMACGLGLCAAVRPELVLVGAGYVALTLTYTLVWRHVPLLDVVAIAGGFVLRAWAGGVAARVDLSEWFMLVVSFAAVLIAVGKRSAELRRTRDSGASGRRVLNGYTERRLAALLILSGAGALGAYVAWAIVVPITHGMPWRPLTIAPFAACLLRYMILVRKGDSEAPEQLLLHDRSLLLGASTWVALFALGVSAGA
jgi:decaprenyl-phosphate phosphoribosyltransferase